MRQNRQGVPRRRSVCSGVPGACGQGPQQQTTECRTCGHRLRGTCCSAAAWLERRAGPWGSSTQQRSSVTRVSSEATPSKQEGYLILERTRRSSQGHLEAPTTWTLQLNETTRPSLRHGGEWHPLPTQPLPDFVSSRSDPYRRGQIRNPRSLWRPAPTNHATTSPLYVRM